jgi:hypothetical protein
MLRRVGDAVYALQCGEPVPPSVRWRFPAELASALAATRECARDLDAGVAERLLRGQQSVMLAGERVLQDHGESVAPALEVVKASV